MFDTHIHSYFSGDSEEDPYAILKVAKEKHLSGIIFTDHMDFDFQFDPLYFYLDVPKYQAFFKDFILENQSKDFYIGMGIEIGLQAYLKEKNEEVINQADFDYCIASIHFVDGIDPYYPEYFSDFCNNSVEEGYRRYLNRTLENIMDFDNFDSLGHLDFVLRYGNAFALNNNIKAPLFYSDENKEIIDEILNTLIKKDKCLEVNTGSFTRGLTQPNPSYDIIKRYKELGGKLITIGSDAHEACHLAMEFPSVSSKLKEMGFNMQMVYKKRKPMEMPL